MVARIKYSETPGFMAFGKWQATRPDEPSVVYTTNERGEGLFTQQHSNGDVNQILGLGQFRPRDYEAFKRLFRNVRRDED